MKSITTYLVLTAALLLCLGCSSASRGNSIIKSGPDDATVNKLIYDLASGYETDADSVVVAIESVEKKSTSTYEVTARVSYEYFTMIKSRSLKTMIYQDDETKEWDCQFYTMFQSPFYGDASYDFFPIEGVWKGTSSNASNYEYAGKDFQIKIENTEPVILKGDTYVDGSITISHNFESLHGSKELAEFGVSYGSGTVDLEKSSGYGFEAAWPLSGAMFGNEFVLEISEGKIRLEHPMFGNQNLQPAS